MPVTLEFVGEQLGRIQAEQGCRYCGARRAVMTAILPNTE
jgi:hypothetical protein